MLELGALASGWLLIVLMFITCIDVFSRKLGIPIPLTKFQEFEWHLHTVDLFHVDGLQLHDQRSSPS